MMLHLIELATCQIESQERKITHARRLGRSKGTHRAYFICNKIGHFAQNCLQSKQSIGLLSEITDYTSVLFSEDDDLESVFSLENMPTEKTIFCLYVYEEYDDDHYQISEPKPNVKEETHSITVILQAEIKVYASKSDKPIMSQLSLTREQPPN